MTQSRTGNAIPRSSRPFAQVHAHQGLPSGEGGPRLLPVKSEKPAGRRPWGDSSRIGGVDPIRDGPGVVAHLRISSIRPSTAGSKAGCSCRPRAIVF